MISKISYSILVLFFLFSCSSNPVDIDYKIAPIKAKEYERNYLNFMLPDSNGTFWALSDGDLFHINPSDTDSVYGIVKEISINYYGGKLFYDPNGQLTLFSRYGLYHINSDSIHSEPIDIYYNSNSWSYSSSVSSDSILYFLEGNGRFFTIIKWNGNDITRLFSDTAFYYPYSSDIYFDADNGTAAIVYKSDSSDFWIHIMHSDTLYKKESVFELSDSVNIRNVFILDKSVYMLLTAKELHASYPRYTEDTLPYKNNYSEIRTDFFGIIKIIENGNFQIFKTLERDYSHGDDYIQMHRTTSEVLLQNDYQYITITPSSVRFQKFRNYYSVNSYNLMTFTSDSKQVFFDEGTQSFIYLNDWDKYDFDSSDF